MRRPTVNYRNFQLSKLNDPEFSHLKYLLGWVIYFLLFYLTERLIPADKCYSVHCILDDLVPFNEFFLIPYVLWYFLILFTLLYFALYNADGLKRLQIYFITTQLIAVTCYILFPTRQDLRPIIFPRENFLTDGVGLLYRIDTNTGVCPSMHVAFSIAFVSAWTKDSHVHWCWKLFIIISAVLICLSTLFIKQHSALDFFAALPVCLLAEWVAYGNYFKRKYRKFYKSID